MRYGGTIKAPGVVLAMASSSAKLSPVERVDRGPGKKPGIRPKGPYCASTYVSIAATCPDTCGLKNNGCYAQSGSHRRIMGPLDEAAHWRPGLEVAAAESAAVRASYGHGTVPQDGAKGGRDLRLHVGGDSSGTLSTRLLADAADDYRRRGGGTVWTYTHRWPEIPAEEWGDIAVWASCESTADVLLAHQSSYRAALVVAEHPSERMYERDGLKILPCPWETRGKTCVECRLCLDAPIDPRVVIGFAAHGEKKKALKRRLTVLA